MGCSGSSITEVKSMKSSELNEGEDDTESKQGCRGESAVSKFTTDSGVVLEHAEFPTLPGTLARILPPLAAHRPCLTQEMVERPGSGEILEELLSQGLITTVPMEHLSGETYNILVDGTERVNRRPPPRLESLKCRKNESVTKDDIDEKMRRAEDRRRLKEEELRVRLRTRSGRVRNLVAANRDGDESTPVEIISPNETPTTSGEVQPDPVPPKTHGEGDLGGYRESGGPIVSASLEMENDSTFQQPEQIEIF
ncbi:hypothetical protein DPEC_G00288250 [Dallia pectoralis]|uniref:Uncharacterized protein n=1 Tax=Dallia pectoralis TaxID=75939 RepID=A0ACC2FKL2_DALPE|nr:hypothetical protein DPEC_G00288250 [Dallia pectoralis]